MVSESWKLQDCLNNSMSSLAWMVENVYDPIRAKLKEIEEIVKFEDETIDAEWDAYINDKNIRNIRRALNEVEYAVNSREFEMIEAIAKAAMAKYENGDNRN